MGAWYKTEKTEKEKPNWPKAQKNKKRKRLGSQSFNSIEGAIYN